MQVEKNIPGCHDEKLKKIVTDVNLSWPGIEPMSFLMEYVHI